MNQVKRYLGWIIAGGVALAALGVFLGLGMAKIGKIGEIEQQLTRLTNDMGNATGNSAPPRQEDIQAFKDLHASLSTRRDATKRFYQDAADNLTRWFEECRGIEPMPSSFKTFYLDRQRQLEDALHNAQIEIGYPPLPSRTGAGAPEERGFNWENLDVLEQQSTHMPLVQRRFWVRQHLVNLLTQTQPGLEVTRFAEVRFWQKIAGVDPDIIVYTGDDILAAPRAVEQDGYVRAQIPRIEPPLAFLPQVHSGAYGSFSSMPSEFILPSNQGQTLTFSMTIVLPASKATEVVRRLMDQSAVQRPILLRVIAWRVLHYITPEKEIPVPGMEDEIERLVAEAQARLAPPPVLFMVTAQALVYKEPPRPPPEDPTMVTPR